MMLRALLAKDLRRAWRNPLPWLVNLVLPVCITALIGLAFGHNNESNQLGRIRFAVVDEDNSPLTGFLRSAASQDKAAQHLEPVFLDRETALRQINDNEISAVVIIPKDFTHDYLNGNNPVTLELIKNPAESIHPAVLEELLGALVTALNAVSRNFQSEFPDWAAVLDHKADYHQISTLIERAGNRFDALRQYVIPPLVSYEKEVRPGEAKSGAGINLFAYLLVGMVAMFLLFLAGTGMTDLHRELRMRTFARYHTLHQHLLPFVAGKALFTVVMLLFSGVVMLAGGGLIFRIHWQQPLPLAALTFSYACFAAGLMALLAALVTDERAANTFNYIAAMTLAISGGCMVPASQLPDFMRHHLTPLLPTAWFTDTARELMFGGPTLAWIPVSLKLVALGALLLIVAALLLRRRFAAGGHA